MLPLATLVPNTPLSFCAQRREVHPMWTKFIVAAAFTLPLLYLALAPLAPNVPLLLPSLLDPMQNPAAYALAEFVLVLPVIGVGHRIYTTGALALVRRRPNADTLVAVGTSAAFLSSAFHVALILLDIFGGAGAGGGGAVAGDLGAVGDVGIAATGDLGAVAGTGGLGVVAGKHALAESLYFAVAGLFITLTLLGKSLGAATASGNSTMAGGSTEATEGGAKTPITHLADVIVGAFVPIVCGLAVAAGIAWYLALTVGGFPLPPDKTPLEFALLIAVSVLIIACPCALALASSSATMVGTGKAAKLGIFIKSDTVLDLAHTIDTVMFDKAGTVTEGQPSVTDVIPVAATRLEDALQLLNPNAHAIKDKLDHALFELVGDSDALSKLVGGQEDRVLALAAAAAKGSGHPLGQALVEEAARRSVTLGRIEAFKSLPGRGIDAAIEGQRVLIGNRLLMEECAVAAQQLESMVASFARQGKTSLYVAVDGAPMGIITATDRIRPSSRAAIKRLQAQGLEVYLLAGDSQQTAAAIALELDITEVCAEILPQDKMLEVKRYQARGRRVALVAATHTPALAQADLGIVIATGSGSGSGTGPANVDGSSTNAAIESADIVLACADLCDVPRALELSRRTLRAIKQNLVWAFAYNAAGIPIAAGLLYLFGGPLLTPLMAAACMGLSSISVAANTLRLKCYKPN
jgi:Cu+-exporting ATPase